MTRIAESTVRYLQISDPILDILVIMLSPYRHFQVTLFEAIFAQKRRGMECA